MELNHEPSFQPQNLLSGIDRLARLKKEDQRLRTEISRLEDQITLQHALLEQIRGELAEATTAHATQKLELEQKVATLTNELESQRTQLQQALDEETKRRTLAEEQHAKLLRFVSSQVRENAEIAQAQEELQVLRDKYKEMEAELVGTKFTLKEEKSRRMNFEAEAARLRFLLAESKGQAPAP